jgi:hypothetical protein
VCLAVSNRGRDRELGGLVGTRTDDDGPRERNLGNHNQSAGRQALWSGGYDEKYGRVTCVQSEVGGGCGERA